MAIPEDAIMGFVKGIFVVAFIAFWLFQAARRYGMRNVFGKAMIGIGMAYCFITSTIIMAAIVITIWKGDGIVGKLFAFWAMFSPFNILNSIVAVAMLAPGGIMI